MSDPSPSDAPDQLAPGDLAPDFALPDVDGETFTVTSLRGRRTLLVFLTPETGRVLARDLAQAARQLEAAGVTTIAVSPVELAALTRFRDDLALPYRVVHDPDWSVHQAFGAGTASGDGFDHRAATVVVDAHGDVEHTWYGASPEGHLAEVRGRLGV